MKKTMNKAWHAANKMPAKASADQRIRWHLAHVANCGCRPIPAKLLPEIKKRGLRAPHGGHH